MEADAVIDVGDVEESKGSEREADRDDGAWIEIRGKYASYGHHDRERYSARRQCQACLLSRISKIVLQKLRQKNCASVENDAKDETECDRSSEVALAQQPQVHDRVFMRKLADDQSNQCDRRQ